MPRVKCSSSLVSCGTVLAMVLCSGDAEIFRYSAVFTYHTKHLRAKKIGWESPFRCNLSANVNRPVPRIDLDRREDAEAGFALLIGINLCTYCFFSCPPLSYISPWHKEMSHNLMISGYDRNVTDFGSLSPLSPPYVTQGPPLNGPISL